MPNTLSLVMVSQSARCLAPIEQILSQQGYQPMIKWVSHEEDLADYLADHFCNIIIAAHDYTDFPLKKVFKQTQNLHPHCLFLALFSKLDEQAIMEAIRIGVDGFLLSSNLQAIIPALNSYLTNHKKPIQKFLRNSEPILEALLEESSDCIWAKHRDGRYLLINPAGAKFLGRTINDILGKADDELFSPTMAAKIRSSDLHVMQSGKTQTVEEPLLTPDGLARTFQAVKGVFRDDTGNIEGLIGIVRDISEQKKSELALQQAKEVAEKMTLRKSEFLATMSHEIRTPLNAVLGIANLLTETPLDSKQREFIDILLSSGKLLLSIINDILDYSKIEAGKIELKKETVHLESFINLVMSVFHHLTHEKGLQIYFTISKKVPSTIVADTAWLRQILLNLISNAVKHTERGHIQIRVSLEKETQVDPTGAISLQFQVEDTGSGIPADKQQSIFTSFCQVTPGLNGTSGSTGLGLSICKMLVELMGGRIWVNSHLNQGSTFFFTIQTFPAEQALTSQHSQPIKSTTAISDKKMKEVIPIRILVAEDNPTNRLVMKNQFESLGYEPVFAHDGLEVLERLSEQPFNLVFMDIQMPKLNGLEATRQIRQDASFKASLCIIAITAFTSQEDESKCKAVGMNDFLIKPTSKEDIQKMILKWFGSPINSLEAQPHLIETTTHTDILDIEELQKRIPFKPDLLRELFDLFRQDGPRLIQSLQEAYANRDAKDLKKYAHEMKGPCMFMGANRLRRILLTIEQDAFQHQWQNIGTLLESIETEFVLLESKFEETIEIAVSITR